MFAVWRAVASGERSNKKFTFVILFISVNASLCKLAALFFWRVTKNKFRVKEKSLFLFVGSFVWNRNGGSLNN